MRESLFYLAILCCIMDGYFEIGRILWYKVFFEKIFLICFFDMSLEVWIASILETSYKEKIMNHKQIKEFLFDEHIPNSKAWKQIRQVNVMRFNRNDIDWLRNVKRVSCQLWPAHKDVRKNNLYFFERVRKLDERVVIAVGTLTEPYNDPQLSLNIIHAHFFSAESRYFH